MINEFRKLIIYVFVCIILQSNVCYAEVNYTGDFNTISDANTTAFLDKNSRSISIRDLMVIGDSYAVVFSYFNEKTFNYIVHPGYTVKEIYDELLPIYNGQYKYIFLLYLPYKK